MKALSSLKRFWTGTTRRRSAARPEQRLTGFEALEPRTVLSASGMMMFGPGGYAEPHREEVYEFLSNGHSPHGGGEYGGGSEREFMGGERLMPPGLRDVGPHETYLYGRGEQGETYRQPPVSQDPIAPPPNVRPLSTENSLSPRLNVFTAYTPAVTTAPAELIIVRTVPSTRPAFDFASGLSVGDNRYVLPVITVTFTERRIEGQPSVSLRETSNYGLPARLAATSNSAAESEAGGMTGEHGLTPRSASSPVLVQLASTPASLYRADGSAVDDSGRLDERASLDAKEREAGDGDGELVELDSAELARQKRKSLVADAAAHAPVASRLQRLADVSLAADAPSLLRDVARLIDGSSAFAALIALPSSLPDDGLVELLAADVSSLMTPSPVPAGLPVITARATALEPGVALYQAFEIATGDAASPGEANVAQVVDLPPAAPAEQLARAD